MKKIALLFIALCITSCDNPPPPAPLPPISFSQYQPINMNVAHIEVVEEYKSPMRAPNMEHTMPVTPADAVQLWVHDRLRAVGKDKLLQVIIKDANVIATDLPKKGGITGFFTNDQDKRYDAKLRVEVRIYGDAALSEANAEAVVSRTITLPEDTSVALRKDAYQRMVLDLVTNLNAELEKNMFSYMGNYIVFAR